MRGILDGVQGYTGRWGILEAGIVGGEMETCSIAVRKAHIL